ncbi:E3 SUMO-protein ligase-like protein [Emericellopsis cladophorae]|uniref:E3 SUMO-protein ligase-like protein n=1 Tax=Emericellopsis cladophorae TaxID=2686198 RepID=A0A9Q0BHL3_9HYPO|nr:E3 SUMO-protein ligase-like protein [Emericellopsis cladophorae]KAI6784519.1 E3 SUMO-protein ligase-like protein [Emericellopsis cladophorae]
MPPRRLVNRVGGDVRTYRSTPGPEAEEPVDYEPPSFPLSAEAINNIQKLSNGRDASDLWSTYKDQVKEALRNLGHSVYDMNDRVKQQQRALAKMQADRAKHGTEKSDDEEKLEQHITALQSEVDELTQRSEFAVRTCIDRNNAIEDDKTILGDLYTQSHANFHQRRCRGDEDNVEAPAESVLTALQQQRAEKNSHWASLENRRKYAQHNDYIAFKKLWHDGAVGDDGPPLADSSKWFKPDGAPVMVALGSSRGPAEDESDEDIAVAREVVSLNCPLTLRPLEEPYSNTKCKHTFEKDAIKDYLRNATSQVQCPQTGCAEIFSWRTFRDDFYLDQAVLRRIQRAKQAKDNDEMDDDSDEDE